MIIFNQVRIIFHNFKVTKAIEPQLRKQLNCLNYVYTLITNECSYAYMCVLPGNYYEISKITKFISLYHFSKRIPFSK